MKTLKISNLKMSCINNIYHTFRTGIHKMFYEMLSYKYWLPWQNLTKSQTEDNGMGMGVTFADYYTSRI